MSWLKTHLNADWLISIGAVLVTGAMVYVTQPQPVQPTVTPQIATVNPEVKHEEKIDVPVKTPKATIKAYSSKVKAGIVLPKNVLDSADSVLLESSTVAASEKRQVVSTVVDVTTGEATTYVSVAPEPWLSFENRGAVSVDYGFKRGLSEPVTRINVRQDLVQTKSVHWGVSASAYTDGDYFVGVGGSYRW
jgi:hypothetical protein